MQKEWYIRMNNVVLANLRMRLGDIVFVHQCANVKYGLQIRVLPLVLVLDPFS